ncbi:MAG TPA: aldo/keto reductase [Solirubrobacteraceae bacterium]|nr:aldo/keto reductase [Solirubrobacteraceae bacterium]
MSELGLGLAALGRPAYITLGHGADVQDRTVAGMERAAHAVLDRAYDAGLRRFDAARSYGRAEAFLASWLSARGLGRGDAWVSSKWGYRYTGAWRVDAAEHEIKDLSGAQLRRQWAQTSAQLGPWLWLYQIHSATVESGVLDDADVRAGLDEVRAAGVRVGLSVTGTGQAATIERALEVGGFDAVQATWNLHERSVEEALARAHAAGLEVYVKEALANGRLAGGAAPPALVAAARERGTTPDALALAAALAQPWATVVLSGAATVAQLESNLAACEVAWDGGLEELREPAEEFWAARAALPWN